MLPNAASKINPHKVQAQQMPRSISHAKNYQAFKGSVISASVAETAMNDFLTTNRCC